MHRPNEPGSNTNDVVMPVNGLFMEDSRSAIAWSSDPAYAWTGPYVVVDGSATIMPAIRAAVSQAGADQPVYDVRTVRELAARSMSQRFPMILMGTFAALALLLAPLGTFGVISYSLTRRVQEIGVRMAPITRNEPTWIRDRLWPTGSLSGK
ncbi:MAG: hypothetical protein M3Y72_24170 [Acidobacteriota bacterium]|nr:hypothetical protein [Acidobacteriota bacterium]